jgi:hypothetical protein
MNNTFDLRRFGLYARKEFRENWKAYTLFLIGIVVIQFALIYQLCDPMRDKFYYKQLNHYTLNPYQTFFTSAILTLWLVGSYVFSFFSTSSKAQSTLTLPVSALERFSFAWIITLPVSLIIVAVLWELSWVLATPIIASSFPKAIVDYKDKSHFFSASMVSIWLFVYSAAFMLGAVVFKKYNFLKTLATGVLALLTLYLLHQWVITIILPNVSEVTPLSFLGFRLLNVRTVSNPYLQLSSTFELPHTIWWAGCLPIILWVTTYLKIKEKEV